MGPTENRVQARGSVGSGLWSTVVADGLSTWVASPWWQIRVPSLEHGLALLWKVGAMGERASRAAVGVQAVCRVGGLGLPCSQLHADPGSWSFWAWWRVCSSRKLLPRAEAHSLLLLSPFPPVP